MALSDFYITHIDGQPVSDILAKHEERFDSLPTFFEGNSRILKEIDNSNYLIGKLKPTVFSYEAGGPVPLEGIDFLRAKTNQLLCSYLTSQGIKTSTIWSQGNLVLMKKEHVAPIEVVVKATHIGSPKHIYKHMNSTPTRKATTIIPGKPHEPYVRFDWRNPLPDEDCCMPEGLADYFIDTTQAKKTALQAFHALNKLLQIHDFHLLDICFFMNETGDVICAEISTDNMRLKYIGSEPKFQKISSSQKTEIAQALLKSLETPRILISGPFCTGKTTLIKRIGEKLGIPKLIDDTTRPMRESETDGFPYRFINKEEFKLKLNQKQYYEWDHFDENYYGVPADDLYFQKTWIMDVLSTSVPHYKGRIPGLVTIFLNPPPVDILIERARQRGDSEKSIQKRIEAMKNDDSSHCDIIIPDGSIEDKLETIKALIRF